MERYGNFRDELQARTGETEEIIRKFLPKGDRFSEQLVSAMYYSMTAGGKRLRPLQPPPQLLPPRHAHRLLKQPGCRPLHRLSSKHSNRLPRRPHSRPNSRQRKPSRRL